MEIILGINRNPSSTTEFLANFFEKEIGEDLLNTLTESNQNYFEMLESLKKMKQVSKAVKTNEVHQQSNANFINNQTDDMLKKISLECERIRAINNLEVKKEELEKFSNEIAELEANILQNQTKKFNAQEDINSGKLNEEKHLEITQRFINSLMMVKAQDLNKINNLITGQDNVKARLQLTVNQVVKYDSAKDITSYFAYSLAQKELLTLLTTHQVAKALKEELKTDNVNLDAHLEYKEINQAKEKYLDAANGVLYYFLDNDQLVKSEEFMDKTSAYMTDDVRVIEEGYQILLNGLGKRLKEERLNSFLQIKENKKREVINCIEQPKPKDIGHPHPYYWRYTTIMVLSELDEIMKKLNIQAKEPEKIYK